MRLGVFEIRCVVIYGKPSNHVDSAEFNNSLLQYAYQQISKCRIPTLVAGDFNQPLQHSWTLRDARLFDSHSPLCVLPALLPTLSKWQLPRPWAQYEPDPIHIASHFSSHADRLLAVADSCETVDDVSNALQEWSSVLETSVDAALRQQHRTDPLRFPCQGFKRRERGRCQARELVQRPVPQLTRPGRHGDFDTDCEALSNLARELADEFERYWAPMWQRDSGTPQIQTLSNWEGVQQILGKVPSLPVDLLSVSHWKSAIRKMSYRKSTGTCGWSPAELKLLPDAALHVLARIFCRSNEIGLPEHILKARVAVLAKVTCPETIKQSRPIVVFSALYRIWGTVISRQLLKAWSSVFHPGVMGSMPRRSARDLSYLQQHE